MADIDVSYHNEISVKIACSESISKELGKHFEFQLPDTQRFSPKARKAGRHWKNVKRLFNRRSSLLPAGLIKYLFIFAQEAKYSIEFESRLISLNSFTLHEAERFIASLKLHSNGQSLVIRDYQTRGVHRAIQYRRILLQSPTNSGKSVMMYAISRYLLQTDCRRGLIVVPTIGLVEQLYKDFQDYSTINKWPVETHVNRIYDYEGMDLNRDASVTISTWQSIFKLPAPWFQRFDFIIGDEAHIFKAKSLTHIMALLSRARYRIGTTGTLDGKEVHQLQLEGMFGHLDILTTNKEMMEKKFSSQLIIYCITLVHPLARKKQLKKAAYPDEVSYLNSSSPRNHFIKNLTLSLKGNTLLLFQYVGKHGRILFDLIQKETGKRKVFFVYGGTDVEDREAVRAIVEKETDAIIVASYGVFSTGVNIKRLHNLIFASPSKSKIRVLQSIGRGLRVAADKTVCTLYDVSDDLRIKDWINHTLNHFLARWQIYHAEQFKVKQYLVDLQDDRDDDH